MYRHTQFGTVTVLFVFAGALILAGVSLTNGWRPMMTIVAAMLVLVLVLHHSLTIEVDPGEVRCFFGIGLIRRRFPMSDIVAAAAVKNPWYWGWGIRLTPVGWMFNVSGLEAVELELRSGKRFRIGTDAPLEVVRAIDQFKS